MVHEYMTVYDEKYYYIICIASMYYDSGPTENYSFALF